MSHISQCSVSSTKPGFLVLFVKQEQATGVEFLLGNLNWSRSAIHHMSYWTDVWSKNECIINFMIIFFSGIHAFDLVESSPVGLTKFYFLEKKFHWFPSHSSQYSNYQCYIPNNNRGQNLCDTKTIYAAVVDISRGNGRGLGEWEKEGALFPKWPHIRKHSLF